MVCILFKFYRYQNATTNFHEAEKKIEELNETIEDQNQENQHVIEKLDKENKDLEKKLRWFSYMPIVDGNYYGILFKILFKHINKEERTKSGKYFDKIKWNVKYLISMKLVLF